MKILHIIPSLMAGGAERLVIDICNELDKRNDLEVKLLVLSDRIDFDKKMIDHHGYLGTSSLKFYDD